MNNYEKYLKYKLKYFNLKNNIGGVGEKKQKFKLKPPPPPTTNPPCFLYYDKLFKLISTADIKELKFTEFCEKHYVSREDIKKINNNDTCHRVSKRIFPKFYSNTYNPVWCNELIRKVANEKAVEVIKSCIDNYIQKRPISEYKTLEIKKAEEEVTKIIIFLIEIRKIELGKLHEEVMSDKDLHKIIDELSKVYYI